MGNTNQIHWIFITLGLSFIIVSSYSGGIDFSVAQQQVRQNMSEPSFLMNSTSFGNATADLKIKHAPTFSTLTIQPWPIVEPSQEFNITGTLVDKITFQPIVNSEVSFLYESASEAIPPFSLQDIDAQNTDTNGKFNASTSAPDVQGIISITAVYDGSGLYHSVASDPALVIVSNSTLPP